jgi:hypothetical protein
MADPNYMLVVRDESSLIKFIRLRMSTLRLGKIIPTWSNYISSTSDWREIERTLTWDAKKKFRAWWIMMFELMRHEKDLPSVQLAVCYLVRERQRRSYSKEFKIDPAKFGVPSDHAWKIEEHVKRHYESLNPEKL